MNSPKIYIIVITVIALGIVGYTIYKSKTSSTPSPTQAVTPVASYTPSITYGPTSSPIPTQAVTPVASYTPAITYGPTPSATQAVTPVASDIIDGPTPTPFFSTAPTKVTAAPTVPPKKAPMAVQFPDGYTQIVRGNPFYWPNSTVSFKNISNKTITINTAQLENGYPNMTVPTGMTASGTQRYNLPVLGTLSPGDSTSFKMPDLNPGVSTPDYGNVNYSFTLLHLVTDLDGGSNMWFTREGDDRISFNSVPTTNIIVQYHL